jgi:hypothetical protein
MVHPRVAKFLAGVAAGSLGGVALLTLLSLSSIIDFDPWWRYANLLGTAFYGPMALQTGPGLPTFAGAAVQVLLCGFAGGIFGLLFAGNTRGPRLALLGMAAGLVWMYFAEFFFRRVAPLISLYSQPLPTALAHVVFGACLATSNVFLPKPDPLDELAPQVETAVEGGQVRPDAPPPNPGEANMAVTANGDGSAPESSENSN